VGNIGEIEVVHASITGSIIGNLLLITCCAHMFYYLRSPEAPAAQLQEEHAEWSGRKALAVLLGSAAALTAVSEVLVHTLEPTVEALGVSRLFVGIILIPLIGNLAEHVVGITLAYKNKMDVSLLTSIGSATVGSSTGRICWARTLPSSTPHWSNESMFQMAPWVKTLCS